MAGLDFLFGKRSQPKKTKSLSKFQENLRIRASGGYTEDDVKRAHHIKEEINELIKMFPGSPEFLGRAAYTVNKKKLSFIKRKTPDISELRELVNKSASKTSVVDSRMQISKLLKRHPAYPDLRALNAIQIYNDASQSGLEAKKIKVIQGALREITRALYNGGVSLFNINWFIKLYIRYIDALRDRYQHEYSSTKNHFSKEIRLLSDELRRKQIQLTVMSTVKTKLSGLAMLNARLKGTIYTVSSISIEDVKKASLALKIGDGSKKIGDSGKTATHIIYVIMTLNLLFARIPILDDLVKTYQKNILDANKDLVLQKIMVNNMRRVTEFQLNMAMGDRDKTQEVANKMYLDMIDIIKQYLDHGIITKQYEVDPFIKAAWIVKESKGLFNDAQYRTMLENSLKLIDVVFSKRVQVKGAFDLAKSIRDDIHFIMIEAGWLT